MPTINISFSKEQCDFIEASVASGAYAHYSDVVREAVRLYMQREAEKLEWLRAAVQEGIDSAERGELIPVEDVLAELAAERKALRAQRQHTKRNRGA